MSDLGVNHKFDIYIHLRKNGEMKIITKNQDSSLSNQDIKWYLSDETLWITKFYQYEDVENSIGKSIGSFNWLYTVNDTILFNEKDRKFETAIIDLAGKIITADMDEFYLVNHTGKRGDLFLDEKKYCNFEFSSTVIYTKEFDYLVSPTLNMKKQDFDIIFFVSDFGFIIINDQLEGWILKNASKYICSQADKRVTNNCPELLENYLKALELWAEDDENLEELEKLLKSIKTNNDDFSLIIKECIWNIL